MNKTFRSLSLILALFMVLSAFTACNLEDWISDNIQIGDPTITWVYGQKVLREETVSSGTVLEEWTPSYQGKEFLGWFADAGLVEAFDFTAPVKKDTIVYASFKEATGGGGGEFVMPDWYLIGSGLGDLSVSAWNHDASAANLGMTDAGAGLYKITVTLYAGDSFQVVHDLGWDGQVGITGVVGIETNAETGIPEAKDENGNVIFYGGGGYGSDITLAEGQDGKYEITFNSLENNLTFALVEKLDPHPDAGVGGGGGAADLRFVGTFNEWSTSYGDDDYKLTLSDDGKTWEGTFTVTEDMYRDWTVNEGADEICAAIKLYDTSSSKWISVKGGDNAFLTVGTYHFSYVNGAAYFTVWADGEEPPVDDTKPGTGDNENTSTADIRFIGTFNEWATVYTNDEYKLTLSDDGKTWIGVFTVTEDMYRDWTVNEGADEICAALKLYDVASSKWISVHGGDNAFLTAGTYHFSYVDGDDNFTVWADGEEPPVDDGSSDVPSGEPASIVYLVPESWEDGTLYGAWCWATGGDGAWYTLTDNDNDGVWELAVPNGCDNVIFVDFVAGTTDPDWNAKRVQTSDMKIPTDSNVYYHADTNTWSDK